MKAAAALSIILLTTALQAQSHREAITVEVVNVPVYVQREGAPVEGLTREDFELLVNGKPVSIEYFDVIGDEATAAGGATTAAAPATPMRERRLFFFVFDVAFSRSYLIERARNAAVQFMKDASPGDYFAVGTFAKGKGVQILVPFTNDTAAVQLAIQGKAGGEDPLRLVVSRDARTGMIAEVPGEAAEEFPTDAASKSSTAEDEGASNIPRVGETRLETNERLRQLNLGAQRPIIEEQIATLGELARRLAPLEGQKHVILLSEGWDVTSLDNRVGGGGGAKLGWTGPYMTRLLDAMVKPFHESGIFLHSLDVTGLNLRGRASRQESLQQLATRTGGEYMHDRNDLRAAITDITHTYSRGYLLGFRPPAGVKSGYNKIAVRVKGEKGVKLRYRVGFDAQAPEANPIDALHLADVVLNDVPQTGVSATLTLFEGQLQARIPMDQLTAVLGKPARAELMVYVFDAKGAAIHFQRQLFDVPMGATGILPVNFALGLQPGEYTVKVLLRAGESLGFSKVKLNVKP